MLTSSDYRGAIIQESLEDKRVLEEVNILETKIEAVTPKHGTPWIEQWTLHTVEVPEGKAAPIADRISRSLDRKHKASWYADFMNDRLHYIIFRDKIFLVNRRNKAEYDEAVRFGLSIGIPNYQLDFSRDTIV